MNPPGGRSPQRTGRLAQALARSLAGASLLVLGHGAVVPPDPSDEEAPPPDPQKGDGSLPRPTFASPPITGVSRPKLAAPRRFDAAARARRLAAVLSPALAPGMAGARSRLIEKPGPAPALPPVAPDSPLTPALLAAPPTGPAFAPERLVPVASDAAAPAADPVAMAALASMPSLGAAPAAGKPAPATPSLTIPVRAEPDVPVASRASAAPVPALSPAKEAPGLAGDIPRPAFGGPAVQSGALPEPAFGPAPAVAKPAFATPRPEPRAGGLAGQGATGPPPAQLAGGDGSLAGAGAAVTLSSDDELILQIETQAGETGDTLVGYGTRAGVYLPLGGLARFLEVGIAISDEGQYASGWVIDEKHTLVINLREGTMLLGGKPVPLARGDAVAFEGELYLRADRLPALFPLTLTVNQRAQTVAIRTLQPFPFEQRFEREKAREKLAGRGTGGEAPKWPREATPWAALSFPVTDVETRLVSDSALGPRAETDLRLAGDLAFMTARVFASTSSIYGLTAARVELGRQDPDARLLGPLRASAFSFGDVSTANLPMGLRGTAGRGATLTNGALSQVSVFDKVDFRGELPNGNEVELYRNNTLIASTRTPVNGRYEFLQVPVDFGLNVFRLVFYGPQGQRREEVRRISVGDGRLGKGEFTYTVGAAQKDINLLGVRQPNFLPGPDYGHWRASAQVQYGVSTQLTATASAAWFETGGGARTLLSGGLRAGLGGMAVKLDAGFETAVRGGGAGQALELGLGGKLAGFSYALTHAEYRGHFSDEVRAFTADDLTRATEANVTGTVDLGWLHRNLTLPVSARFRRIAFADGHVQTDGSVASSLPVAGTILSSRLEYASSAIPGTNTFRGLTGSFDLATLGRSRTRYRATLDYGLLPRARINAASFEVDHAFDDDTRLRAGIGRTFVGSQTTFALSGLRQFRSFSLAFAGNYTVPSKIYDVQLRLGVSFGRNPLTGRLFTARPGLAGQGAIAIRAFEDADGNRRYGPGERLLPKVEFGNGVQNGTTGTDGTAFIGAIGDGVRTTIRLDTDTLPDIDLAPVTPAIEVVPRAGRIHVSDFAIVALSEIEGTARFAGPSGRERGVSGLVLLLHDVATGRQVARIRTESDGFFSFEAVRPGKYRIDLDPGQAQSLRLRKTSENEITIGARHSLVRQAVQVTAEAR